MLLTLLSSIMEVSSNILMLLFQNFLGMQKASNFTHFLVFKKCD